ncbi:hypothetical protein HYALB_00007789 [Hymenoscyphus albidus]|uniref:Uncharacterized protein n=1 Tax=Hymenoscyphus albidus TaxID=595503 RepID=A0A9N9LRR6_9HELO|nr:hypothetical protein HYALB_00007789 [Hymenoscyphus albidus]
MSKTHQDPLILKVTTSSSTYPVTSNASPPCKTPQQKKSAMYTLGLVTIRNLRYPVPGLRFLFPLHICPSPDQGTPNHSRTGDPLDLESWKIRDRPPILDGARSCLSCITTTTPSVHYLHPPMAPLCVSGNKKGTMLEAKKSPSSERFSCMCLSRAPRRVCILSPPSRKTNESRLAPQSEAPRHENLQSTARRCHSEVPSAAHPCKEATDSEELQLEGVSIDPNHTTHWRS